MHRIEIHPEARRGRSFQDEFMRATRRIAESPERWPIGHAATRQVLMHRFPYLVCYEVEGERVLILAVAHQKQKPGYWSRRKR